MSNLQSRPEFWSYFGSVFSYLSTPIVYFSSNERSVGVLAFIATIFLLCVSYQIFTAGLSLSVKWQVSAFGVAFSLAIFSIGVSIDFDSDNWVFGTAIVAFAATISIGMLILVERITPLRPD